MSSKTERPYNQLSFALEILKLLAREPRKRQDLADLLAQFLEQRGKPPGDILQKLTRTIRQLRDCGFEIESTSHSPYILRESNFPLILSPEQRQALGMAAHFLADMGFSTQAGYLTRIGQLDFESLSPVQVDFSPPVDYSVDGIPAIVQKLQERFAQQCRYTIRYRSSKAIEQTWDLDRSELRLHNGILYLFAYVPDFNPRHIQKRPNVEQNLLFRVDRILSVGGVSHVRWLMSQFPTQVIRYRMSGPLSTYQPRRNRETVLERDRERGYVDIETVEDGLFWFEKRILQYGSNALVLEPSWLVQRLSHELKKAYTQYALNPGL